MRSWRDERDDARGSMGSDRRMKICEVCRKIILRREDLVQVKDEDRKAHTYCAECAPKGEDEDDAGFELEQPPAEASPPLHPEQSPVPEDARAIDREPVRSSNVSRVGYEAWPGGTGVLEVEFRSGGIYRYLGVPESVYRELMDAPSVGGYLHQRIKGSYACRKVREGSDDAG